MFISKRIFSVFVVLFVLAFNSFLSAEAQKVTIKLGTIAPKGTTAVIGVDILEGLFQEIKDNMGASIKFNSYFGGVMGDDTQMIQKTRLGQLDMLITTLVGLSAITSSIDVFNIAYLIDNYGQFDYVIKENGPYINELFYKNGFISMSLITTEGPHNLYLKQAYRTPAELKNNLKAANYAGVIDDSFYKAIGIPQYPILTTEMYPSLKTGVSNSAILPAAFVIGMQIYSALSYIVDPPIRITTSAILLSRNKWEGLPWDFKVYLAMMQPMMYFLAGGMMRDAASAYINAMYKYGCKKVTLSEPELKDWKSYVMSYRKEYLGSDSEKKELYDRIMKSINKYNANNLIEKKIYQNDPAWRNFPGRLQKLADAFEEYYKNGTKAALLKCENDKIIENWRVYDLFQLGEEFEKTGNPSGLKKWMSSFYAPSIVEEIFSKHLDSVKRVCGSKKALQLRAGEQFALIKSPGFPYKGYQLSALLAK